jgi:hypothetical protein
MRRLAIVSVMIVSVAVTCLSALPIDNILFVNLSKTESPIGKYGMGFISNSAQIDTNNSRKPLPEFMIPVIPRLIRGSVQVLKGEATWWQTFYYWEEVWKQTSASRPIIYQIVLGDDWKYKHSYSPNRDPAALQEWLITILKSRLDNAIKDFVREVLSKDLISGKLKPPTSKNLGEYCQFDIWNEPADFFAKANGYPDEKWFYDSHDSSKSYKDYLATWVETKRFLDSYFQACNDTGWCKGLGPNGEYHFKPPAVGPSFSGYNDYLLRRFYQDAKEKGVKPDILSWHELSNSSLRNVESDITTMKSLVGTETGINVNEWTPGGAPEIPMLSQVNPAINLRFLSVLERQGVIGAKSCWHLTNYTPDDEDACNSSSLGSLLTFPNADAPRSAYWAFERFSRFSGNRLSMSFLRKDMIEKLDGVAAFDSDKSEGWILVGNYNSKRKEPVHILLKGTDGSSFQGKKLVLDHEIISNQGLAPYPSPKQMYTGKEYSLGIKAFRLRPIWLEPGSIAYFHFIIH